MEAVFFLRIWMDVWNQTKEEGLKMPEEIWMLQRHAGQQNTDFYRQKAFLNRTPDSSRLPPDGQQSRVPLEAVFDSARREDKTSNGSSGKEKTIFFKENQTETVFNRKQTEEKVRRSRLTQPEGIFWMDRPGQAAGMEELSGQTRKERNLSPVFSAETMDGEILRLLRQWQKQQNPAETGQQVSISIGQVRENADVDRVMEALTAKLREAHLSGARKAKGG